MIKHKYVQGAALISFGLWAVMALLSGRLHAFRISAWVPFLFVFLSCVLVCVFCSMLAAVHIPDGAGGVAVPAYCSVIFWIVSVLMNTTFLFVGTAKTIWILYLLNVLLIAAYLSVMVLSLLHMKRLQKRIQTANQKSKSYTDVSKAVSLLLDQTDDEEIRKELISLKELVDCSTGTTANPGLSYEKAALELLKEVQTMVAQQENAEDIRKKLKEASGFWKNRNTMQ